MIICFAGADKLDLALHLGYAAHAVLNHGALEISEALGRVVEVRDCLMQGMSRIVGKLMLEVAKCNGALVKILGGLHLLQADSILHKVIDTPAAAIGSLVIRPSLFGRHHMERGTRRVSPRCLAFSRRKSVTPQMFSIRPAGSLNVSVLIFAGCSVLPCSDVTVMAYVWLI